MLSLPLSVTLLGNTLIASPFTVNTIACVSLVPQEPFPKLNTGPSLTGVVVEAAVVKFRAGVVIEDGAAVVKSRAGVVLECGVGTEATTI